MRIAHMSDVHVTAPPRELRWRDLATKRLAGWANLRLLGRYSRFVEAPRVIGALVADLEVTCPDLVVFSGDVTGLGLPSELEHARALLRPLPDRPDVLGIPGNHDVYVGSARRERPFSRTFPSWELSDLPELAAASTAPYPLVRLLGEGRGGIAVIALQTCLPRPLWDSSGRAGRDQLAALARVLADPRVRQRRRLVVLHYALRRHDGEPDTRLHGLRDAEELLFMAAEAGVDAILHGHLHRRFVHARGPATPVPLLCSGSLTDASYERAYHLYEVTADAIDVRVRRFEATTGAFVEAADAEALLELEVRS